MYEFENKPGDKQPISHKPKPAAQRRPRQSGDRLKQSAFGDKYASFSLQDVNTVMPEKMRLKEQQPGERMKTVRPGTYSGSEKSPDKLVELETDTGKAEIGYDRNKMNTVVSFTQDEQTGRGRQVVENKSLVKRAAGGSKFRSNDKSFESGAMSLRVDANTSTRSIRRQLHKGSDKEDPTTMDRVIPFYSHGKAEKYQRLRLLQTLHRKSGDKEGPASKQNQGISKAVTALSNIEGQKARMDMEFRQKFDKAVNKSRSLHQQNDMHVILRRKKRLILEAMAHGELAGLAELAEQENIDQAENMEGEVRAGSLE